MEEYKYETEAIECCPHCSTDNSYPGWDVKQSGYMAVCRGCGSVIMLCDECLHADDNEGQFCDWHRENINGVEYGVCFRGITRNE